MKKKIVEETVEESAPTGAKFNKYGTCIDCQDGIEECLHNSLVDSNGKISCAICGQAM